MPTIGHIGRYALKYQLGIGGLGTVFAAHDPLLSRLIAVKTLNVQVAEDERESFNTMFINEARAAGGLSHPHIVTVFDAGISDQRAYIAMELLKGRDLRQLRQEGWRATPAQAALIVRRVADALAFAHSKGVIHRDIKPANIFMVGRTQPRVLDFGIARVAHRRDGNDAHSGAGSPYYMAPEQVRREVSDRRADVFSLGVVLYELLDRREAVQRRDAGADPRSRAPPRAAARQQGRCGGAESARRRSPRARWPRTPSSASARRARSRASCASGSTRTRRAPRARPWSRAAAAAAPRLDRRRRDRRGRRSKRRALVRRVGALERQRRRRRRGANAHRAAVEPQPAAVAATLERRRSAPTVAPCRGRRAGRSRLRCAPTHALDVAAAPAAAARRRRRRRPQRDERAARSAIGASMPTRRRRRRRVASPSPSPRSPSPAPSPRRRHAARPPRPRRRQAARASPPRSGAPASTRARAARERRAHRGRGACSSPRPPAR